MQLLTISVANLLFDPINPRIIQQTSQKGALDNIIKEQGKKLVILARDIIKEGLNPCDLPMVVASIDLPNNYVVIEGNRRLAAIRLVLEPERAEGTSIFASFKKLNREHLNSIPQSISCAVFTSRNEAMGWARKKHASGLEGAGTEPWSAMAKARVDQRQGLPRPELDVVDFVLSQPELKPEIRSCLEGSNFNITTLARFLESTDVQHRLGFEVTSKEVRSNESKARMSSMFSDIVTIIAEGKYNGQKFTERNIDNEENRAQFLESFVGKHPPAGKESSTYQVAGTPKKLSQKPKTVAKSTLSTREQPNLIPQKFKMELPAGKVNDIFVELKKLDIERNRHAISVLFRVFVEFSLEAFIEKHQIQGKINNDGTNKDSLHDKLNLVVKKVEELRLLKKDGLAPIGTAMANKESLLGTATLNAYVHSRWMDPNPFDLKTTWNSVERFLECIWKSVNNG